MKLSDQVVSLEIAKKLKSLGVKQESFFYWQKIGDEFALSNIGSNIWLKPDDIFGESLQYESGVESFSAFTVAELGEILWVFESDACDGYGEELAYSVTFKKSCEEYNQFGSTEAEARGKMLIYLIENKIIEV